MTNYAHALRRDLTGLLQTAPGPSLGELFDLREFLAEALASIQQESSRRIATDILGHTTEQQP